MKLKILTLTIFIFLLGSAATPLFGAEITFITHNIEKESYTDEQGHLRGIKHAGRRAFNIELIREMMLIMNHPVNFEVMPFERAKQLIISNKKPYALFNIGRRKHREKLMKWVGPLQKDILYLYENKNNPTGIKTLEDVKNAGLVCLIIGSAHNKTLAEKGVSNIYLHPNYQGCFKMLARQRVNLTVISQHSIKAILKQANIPPDLIQNTGVILRESDGYLVFSNIVSDNTVQKWQDALDQLKESGRYQELMEEYLY